MRRTAINRVVGEEGAEIDLTPMLDVVFIMLIFFIVTASFVKETGIDVHRPEAETAERHDQVQILVAVSADNEIWIDRRRVDLRSVRANIERMRAENPNSGVVVQADNKADTETVVGVIDAARAVGIYDVMLSTVGD